MAVIGADGVTEKLEGIKLGDNSPSGTPEDDRIGFIIKQLSEEVNNDQKRETIKDYSWLKNTFIITEDADRALQDWVDKRRFSTLADHTFSSTAPGMSLGVNPKPQMTRTADIRRPGRIKDRDPNGMMKNYRVPHYDINTPGHSLGLGMGRVYAKVFDAHEQRVFMQFGDPQYSSMIFWLGKSFDVHKAILYKRGFISGAMLGAINVLSNLWAISAMPWLYFGKVLMDSIVMPSQFVTLRNNMYTYWTTVDTLVNKMFVRRVRVPFLQATDPDTGSDNPYRKGSNRTTSTFLTSLNNIVPDLVDAESGKLSIFAMALRGPAAMARAMEDGLNVVYNLPTESDLGRYEGIEASMDDYFNNDSDWVRKFTQRIMEFSATNMGADPNEVGTVSDLIDGVKSKLDGIATEKGLAPANYESPSDESDLPRMYASNYRTVRPDGSELGVKTATNDARETADGKQQENVKDASTMSQLRKMGDYMMESLRGGWAFAVFNVEPTGSVGESFSNSTDTNPIETVFNSITSKMRSAFSVGSSMLEIPIIGDVAKFAADSASIVLSNMSFGLANPLLALLYGTTVSLPKHWSSSSVSLPRANYKIRLGTPYGNVYSQLFHIYLPLSMLLPSVMSRGTGLHTHTAPFMCRTMDPGRVNIQYGIVDSLSITRGVSSTSFNMNGHANAIDVEFSVTDLNEMISIELGNNGVLTRAMKNLVPDLSETALDNYVNTVVGMDVYSMFYRTPRIRMKLIERGMALQTLSDPAAMSAAGANIITSITPDWLNNVVSEWSGSSRPLMRQMSGL